MRDIPDQIRRLVDRWVEGGTPGQPPIPWPRQRWLEDFPGNAAALALLPDRLDRAAVRTACADASRSPAQAVEAFLAVMAWGFGDSVGYGRYRTRRILASRSDSAPRLHAVAQAIVTDGPLAGYHALASPGVSRLHGLGPSFGTKLLYFWQPADRRPRALILDAFVAKWLEREVDWRLDPLAWSVDTYRRYLDQMHAWAEALGIEPDEFEILTRGVRVSQATVMGATISLDDGPWRSLDLARKTGRLILENAAIAAVLAEREADPVRGPVLVNRPGVGEAEWS